jgi:hypothetical protein
LRDVVNEGALSVHPFSVDDELAQRAGVEARGCLFFRCVGVRLPEVQIGLRKILSAGSVAVVNSTTRPSALTEVGCTPDVGSTPALFSKSNCRSPVD